MDVKDYTDSKYIPISELNSFSSEFINATKEYRQLFMQIVQLDELSFANVVETPELVKKRYIKNVELKGFVDINPQNYDYIMEMAKMIVTNKLPPDIKIKNVDKLKNLYSKNNNDLTIITNYLLNNIEELIPIEGSSDVHRFFPELSKNQISFIRKYHNPNLNYSLQDFQKLNKSSYETARKSMEKLKDLKLYSQEKIGKKFLYKPTTKITNLLKGDA